MAFYADYGSVTELTDPAPHQSFHDEEDSAEEFYSFDSSSSDSEDEDEASCEEDVLPQIINTDTFTPRPYQTELFKCARNKNSIMVLGTGSGKTFIAIMLIKDFAEQIRGSLTQGSKRSVFVVNTVPLVYQQAAAIEMHSGLKVGRYEGSMGIDFWDDEKWAEELEKNEVLVITAQIFLELVLHARLPLRSVNLLIVDECHHAVGNHPMREIMRQYDVLKRTGIDKCPRVMGLTASVINRKVKKDSVGKTIRELEKTMDSALVTSVDQDVVKKFTTRPKEVIVAFRKEQETEYREIVHAQLGGVLKEVLEREDLDDKVKKFVKKRINNIEHIMDELGDWCVARSIYYEMEALEESAKMEEVPVISELFRSLRERLLEIHKFCQQKENMIRNPRNHISHQVERLIEILLGIKSDDVSGLIFVERRNTAKILYDLFLELAKENEDLSFVKPLYVVGANTRPGLDLKLAELELRKQRETLKKFRNGEANFIISTSVLEEGVDIRKCNAVIRFDKPMNYRAYVQSRGRARAVPSRYVLMVPEANIRDFINDLDVYREIEKILLELCHERELPSVQEIRSHFDEDETIPPYEPYGSQGPKVTANSSISLLNHYCGKLPQDKFTVLAPEVFFRSRDDGYKRAGIMLPTNSPLKKSVLGDFYENKDLAKKSAAIFLCQELHIIGELNGHLRPSEPKYDDLSAEVMDVTLESKSQEQPGLGTKKHRQKYDKEISKIFSDDEGSVYHLYAVEIHPVDHDKSCDVIIDSLSNGEKLGLICKRGLIHCPFYLFGAKFGEVSVRVEYLQELRYLNSQDKRSIRHFHKLTLQSLMHINKTLMEYDPENFNNGLFIVPLSGDSINYELLDQISPLKSLRTDVLKRSWPYTFDMMPFKDAVIFPLYGDEVHQMYYVTEIMDKLSPLSEFPENKMQYKNYEGYFHSRYDASITNKRQSLLAAKHLPKEFNYLRKRSVKKKRICEPPYFIPELCGVIPIKASLWWQLSCIPSILYRLNSLGVAQELSLQVGIFPIRLIEDIENLAFYFKWAEGIAQNSVSNSNLVVALTKKQNEFIHPYMLSHALTLLGANDGFNLERLEVLGDSFLKFIVGEYVSLKCPDDHEGRLSSLRTLLVCNKTLFQLGLKKAIPKKIHAACLVPKVNGILPGFRVKEAVEKQLIKLDLPHDKWHKIEIPKNLDDLEQVVQEMKEAEESKVNELVNNKPGKASCYNPWRQQEVSDKSVADCIEALIGAYLLKCGSDAAKDFLHWMGIGVHKGKHLLKDSLPIPSPIVSKEHWAGKELLSIYKKACLDRLEDVISYKFNNRGFIVQAMTHASYTPNRITENYQRLEFIGDAVLDYLVTGLIYARHTGYTPGEMTDLRSYYVNNETLARVAVKFNLQKYLLHMSQKLQASIENFCRLCSEEEEDLEQSLLLEEDEDDVDEIEVPKCLGDLVESIIGAVYLDSNRNLKKTWRLVAMLMGDVFQKVHNEIPKDCVRQLYENAVHVKFTKVPHENGVPAVMIVEVNNTFQLRGRGKNYSVAKTNAAKKALRKLKEISRI